MAVGQILKKQAHYWIHSVTTTSTCAESSVIGLKLASITVFRALACWLSLGIDELGKEVAAEVELNWMVPLLVEEERDRLMAWQLGVSV